MGGPPPSCDDGNECTDDTCDVATDACQNPANMAPCDDGVFCNGADTCSGGSCAIHPGDPCIGGGDCASSCNEAAGNCLVAAGTPCTDDGN